MQARLVVIALFAATTLAEARPSVTIRGELPFDERSLGEAVELRGITNVDVIVGRDDQGRLVVEAGGRSQTVVLVTSDPQSAARVVAMVVVELVAEPDAAVSVAPPGVTAVVAAAPAPTPSAPSKLSLRVVPALLRDDNGYTTALVTGSLAYPLTPSIRAIGTTGIGFAGKSGDRETIVPVRLGLEGSAGAIALELGAVTHPYSSRCGTGRVATGAYGAVRMFVPIGERARLVIEGGGDFIVDYSETCFESYGYREYGGWLGVGGEWPL